METRTLEQNSLGYFLPARHGNVTLSHMFNVSVLFTIGEMGVIITPDLQGYRGNHMSYYM